MFSIKAQASGMVKGNEVGVKKIRIRGVAICIRRFGNGSGYRSGIGI